MSLKHPALRCVFGVVLWTLSLLPAAARFVTPDEIITSGPLKAPVEKLMKTDAKDKDAAAAIKKASDGGDKDAQFAYAFVLQQAMGGLEAPKDKPMALIEEAKALYEKSAKAGQPAAKNNLGLLKLATGDDAKLSFGILEEAANSGYGKARITMAQAYIDGTWVEKNAEVAMRWLERAQESEPNEANYLMGALNEALKDHAGAVTSLTKAAENKHVPSMMYLGNKFLNGSGVQQDLEKARGWFEKALAAGQTSARVNLGLIVEVEASNEKDTAKQTTLYKKALDFYKQAADEKIPDAFNKLGYFNEKGLGLEKNESKAAEWYEKGAKADFPISMYNWAVMNEEGRGVKTKNEAEAAKFYYEAAKRNFGPAQAALGERYRQGKGGLAKDPVAAMAWMEKAAGTGQVGAQLQLANMLETGEAGFQNLETAAKLYLDAAKKGQPVAMFKIGDMLESGRGMNPDPVQVYGFFAAGAKVVEGNAEMSKPFVERIDALKKKMNAEQLKKAEEFLKQLIGEAAAASTGETPSTPKATETKTDPKKPVTPKPKTK